MKVEIEIPDNVTVGDLITVRGAIFDAAATFVDWEVLFSRGVGAISPAGLLLLRLAAELKRAEVAP